MPAGSQKMAGNRIAGRDARNPIDFASGYPPFLGARKPAASASSSVQNQTSAIVRS